MLSDIEIAERVFFGEGMIDPFVPEQVREVDGRPVVSFGLSSYGYDFRVGNTFRVFTSPDPAEILLLDPKHMTMESCQDMFVRDHEAFVIPPHGFVLATTVETFKIPRDILVTVLGKSTYARCGLILNVTPLESEWTGQVTLEISNTTDFPALVYAGEGIGQAIFHTATPDRICAVSYADRKGKYQNQKGIVLPKV